MDVIIPNEPRCINNSCLLYTSCMKIQPKQISEQTVPVIKTEKDTDNKLIEKVTLPAVGTVHVLSLIHI